MIEYKRNPNVQCLICGRPIYRRPVEIQRNKGRVFCSQACFGISCRNEKPCKICGTPILAGKNKKTCSRACANKNRAGVKYKIGRPKDKAVNLRNLKSELLKIRDRKCERCDYDTTEILQVHHKDRDRENNGFENLELLCPTCHAEEHYLNN